MIELSDTEHLLV